MEKVQTDASNEIKLHLEVEINGVDQSNLTECSGDSNGVSESKCTYDIGVHR